MNFPVEIKLPIAWGDMDAFQHVNNVMYFKYFESVRIKYFGEIAVMREMSHTGIGPILAHTSCQFKLPLTYPDTITVGARVKSMGNSSFVMEYVITSEALEGKVAATGEGVVVMVNYKTGEKVPISQEMRGIIETLEGKKT